MPHRHKIKTGPADFGAHIAQPGTRFWSALPRSYMNRSWVRPARIRNLGFRPFCSAARAETLQHRLLLRSCEVMGRRHIRSDHPGNGPRTMILRKFASHQITGEGVQTLPCLGLKDVAWLTPPVSNVWLPAAVDGLATVDARRNLLEQL